MNALVGNLALYVGAAAAGLGMVTAGLSARRESDVWMRRSRWCLGVVAASLTIAVVTLLGALIGDDMRLEYVAAHSERSMSLGFKVAAWWAGQEGSLLLWAWLVGVMGVLLAVGRRAVTGRGESVTLLVMATVSGFATALMIFVANPFELAAGSGVADGQGLNPLLRHWAMVAHPPMLFLGYAGCTVPFAMMLGALGAGRSDNAWVGDVRRWVLFAWIALGTGIALGGWWAYVQLGWGGYWAWDPVENASLLPWLAITALFHTLAAHRRTGVLKGWTVSLCAITFLLCIFGMGLTRSGVIQSVHAFGKTTVGPFFLGFLVLSSAAAFGVILWRRRLLRSEVPSDAIPGRDGVVMIANVLLLTMAGVTLVGTILPAVSGLFTTRTIAVGAGFYNRLVAPMGVACVALMAIGPLLPYGKAGTGLVRRSVGVPAIGSAAGIGIALVLGLRNPLGLACVGVCVLALLAIGLGVAKTVLVHVRTTGGNPLSAIVHVLQTDHRRMGGQLGHLGVVLVIAGVAGSSLFNVSKNVTLSPGETSQIGRYTLRLEGLREFRETGCSAVEATLVMTASGGTSVTLLPQRRFYDKAQEVGTQVAIRTSAMEDLYVALIGWEAGGSRAVIQARVNPLAIWIWIGAATMICGGIVCLLPKLLPRSRAISNRKEGEPVRGPGSQNAEPEIACDGTVI
jgi:cytochrome c-type biogenesis protein CcmF